MFRRKGRVSKGPADRLRKLLAVPAVLAVGLTSLMGVGASAAHAAPPVPGVVILSPEDGVETPSRTVAFEGAGANGATITLFDIDGNVLSGTEPVVVEGNTWEVVAEFSTDADAAQTVTAVQSFDSVVDSSDQVIITLPTAVPADGGGQLASTGGSSAGGTIGIGTAALLVCLGGSLIALQKLRRRVS